MKEDVPATVFCSTFSGLGCSPSATTPSMLSAMAVADFEGRRWKRKGEWETVAAGGGWEMELFG
jgi:hypothetical protein